MSDERRAWLRRCVLAYATRQPDRGITRNPEAVVLDAMADADRLALVRHLRRASLYAEQRDGAWVEHEPEVAREHSRSGSAIYLLDDREVDAWAREVPANWSTDPARAARRMAACGHAWAVTTEGPIPLGCGVSMCPMCARSKAGRRIARERAPFEAAIGSGAVPALLTLTQRDYDGEPLTVALDRWDAAWVHLRGGTRGARRWWRSNVVGTILGQEWTHHDDRGEDRWHVHSHVLALLPEGSDPKAWGDAIVDRWLAVPGVDAERAPQDCRAADPSALVEILKYPYKPARMPTGAALVSWRSSMGRNLHRRGGAWHGNSRSPLATSIKAARKATPSPDRSMFWTRFQRGSRPIVVTTATLKAARIAGENSIICSHSATMEGQTSYGLDYLTALSQGKATES